MGVRPEGLGVTTLQVTLSRSQSYYLLEDCHLVPLSSGIVKGMTGLIPSVAQQMCIITNTHYPQVEKVNRADMSQK